MYNSLTPDLSGYIKKKLPAVSFQVFSEAINKKNILRRTEILGIFVDSKIDKAVFSQMPSLRFIATFSTGFDHIDLKEAQKRGVIVSNVPKYGEQTVAQHALALMLALSRKLFQSVKRVKEGVYDFHGLRGFDMEGKTIGIIGTGNIGIQLIKMLRGFDLRVLAYDVKKNMKAAKEYKFAYTSFEKLLSESDIISFHAPLLESTYHLIHKQNIKKLKKGVIIINTARGGLIDPEALLLGLEQGKIAGAGLDVLEEEDALRDAERLIYSEHKDRLIRTSLMNNLLIDHPNTIVTPHNAFNSHESVKRILDTSAENICAFMKGKPQNQVLVS